MRNKIGKFEKKIESSKKDRKIWKSPRKFEEKKPENMKKKIQIVEEKIEYWEKMKFLLKKEYWACSRTSSKRRRSIKSRYLAYSWRLFFFNSKWWVASILPSFFFQILLVLKYSLQFPPPNILGHIRVLIQLSQWDDRAAILHIREFHFMFLGHNVYDKHHVRWR